MAPHIEIMCQAGELVEAGTWDRLIANCPPRHSKSETYSVNFPAWYMGRNPTHKLAMITYSDRLSKKNGSRVRERMSSPIFQEIFPDCQLKKGERAKDYFQTTQGGECLFTTIGGQLTGFGANLMIIDDPYKGAKEAWSPVIRENVIEFYRADASTRLMPDGRIILIQTRWHEGDLTGWLLDAHEQEEVDDWKVISFPAIAEEDEGWRKPGEALWPAMWPIEKLLRKKKHHGDWDWAALYQCRPNSIEGREIKRDWWKYYAWNPHLVANRQLAHIKTNPYVIYQSWDTASKTEQHHDFSVCETWLCDATGHYLLDVWRKKVIAPDLFQAAKELALYWRAECILVEDSTPAHAFVQMLQVNTRLPVIPIHPKGDKEARVRGVSSLIKAGRVFLPDQAPWLKDFLQEVTGFPTSAHDDQVDALSQYLHYITMEQYQDYRDGDLETPDDPIDLMDQ